MNRYERSLRDARTEGYRLLEQERAKALAERQNQLNALRTEIESSTEEQKSLLRTQSEEARASLESDARKIAADISRQILNRPSPDFTTTGVPDSYDYFFGSLYFSRFWPATRLVYYRGRSLEFFNLFAFYRCAGFLWPSDGALGARRARRRSSDRVPGVLYPVPPPDHAVPLGRGHTDRLLDAMACSWWPHRAGSSGEIVARQHALRRTATRSSLPVDAERARSPVAVRTAAGVRPESSSRTSRSAWRTWGDAGREGARTTRRAAETVRARYAWVGRAALETRAFGDDRHAVRARIAGSRPRLRGRRDHARTDRQARLVR